MKHYFGYDSIWGGIIGVPAAYGSDLIMIIIFIMDILFMLRHTCDVRSAFASDSQFKSIWTCCEGC